MINKVQSRIWNLTRKPTRKTVTIFIAVLISLIWLYIYLNPSLTKYDVWQLIKTDGLKLLIITIAVTFAIYILNKLTGKNLKEVK